MNKERYLITPSLLNSWAYIWTCADNVNEAESDSICLEDKIAVAQEKAYNDFITTLNREPIEQNEYMLEGIRFEQECYDGKTEISPIIENGQFQFVGKKEMNIGDTDFLLYGRLDVLKGGVIYDIKRVWKYSPPKYLKSHQHAFYFELVPEAYKFQYLIFDGKNYHIETYYRDEVEDIAVVIMQFMNWLKENNLIDLYFEKWKSERR